MWFQLCRHIVGGQRSMPSSIPDIVAVSGRVGPAAIRWFRGSDADHRKTKVGRHSRVFCGFGPDQDAVERRHRVDRPRRCLRDAHRSLAARPPGSYRSACRRVSASPPRPRHGGATNRTALRPPQTIDGIFLSADANWFPVMVSRPHIPRLSRMSSRVSEFTRRC